VVNKANRLQGITDQIVTTEFPSLLDDRFITKEGFLDPPAHHDKPTYKIVAHHYFRLRLLQSEILQVLQHRQAQQARASGANLGNEFMHTKLPSPFLANFDSFRAWRVDIDRRLLEWKDSAPTSRDAGVQFSTLFLELNYWQALIMLYRQSLVVPSGLQDELGNTGSDVGSPSVVNVEEREDEDLVFLKVAEAGQKVLKLYRQLHRVHLVNYTFLATHHLFMAGKSLISEHQFPLMSIRYIFPLRGVAQRSCTKLASMLTLVPLYHLGRPNLFSETSELIAPVVSRRCRFHRTSGYFCFGRLNGQVSSSRGMSGRL
jgi:hypothetical protein